MEKTLTIDGKQVKFRTSGATPLRYKSQFGRDYFSDLLKLSQLENLTKGKGKNAKIDPDYIDQVDFDVFYNISWVLAKTANKDIPEPIEWLDGFDEYPIMEIIPQLSEMMRASLQTEKK